MINIQKLIGPKYFGTSKKRSIFDVGDRSMPGPGAYDNHTINIKKKSPQWPLGLDQNRNTFLYSTPVANPSPQKYKINFTSIEKKSKKMTIPRSKQQIQHHTNSTFYDASYELTKPKASEFSFGNYYGNNYNTLPPGPGQYNVQKAKVKLNNKNGLSSANRPEPYGQEGKNPGPGQYLDIDLQRGTKISFPKASRSQIKLSDPPATFYDISMTKTITKTYKPISEISIQKQKIKSNDMPAPNAYTCQLKRKIPGGAIDKSIRPSLQNAYILDYPSLDKYQTNISQINKKKITFAKQIRRPQMPDQQIPGPKYELNDTFTSVGAKINHVHRDKSKPFVLPGAGNYDINDGLIKRKAQSSIVFTSDRVDFSKTITGNIGPGHYNSNQNYKSQFGKLSKAQKKQTIPNEHNPGVGNYQLPNSIGSLPAYCIAPKKLSQTGYSVFYEKKQAKLYKQKMKKIKQKQMQDKQQQQQQQQNCNPQQPAKPII